MFTGWLIRIRIFFKLCKYHAKLKIIFRGTTDSCTCLSNPSKTGRCPQINESQLHIYKRLSAGNAACCKSSLCIPESMLRRVREQWSICYREEFPAPEFRGLLPPYHRFLWDSDFYCDSLVLEKPTYFGYPGDYPYLIPSFPDSSIDRTFQCILDVF